MKNNHICSSGASAGAQAPPFDVRLLDEAIKDLQKFKEQKAINNLISIDEALKVDFPGQTLIVKHNGPIHQRIKETINLLKM